MPPYALTRADFAREHRDEQVCEGVCTLVVATGTEMAVAVYDDRITLMWRPVRTAMDIKQRTVKLEWISETEIHVPQRFSNGFRLPVGFLSVAFKGTDGRGNSFEGKEIIEFPVEESPVFERAHRLIEGRRRNRTSRVDRRGMDTSIADQISRLARLKRDGFLSEAEFAAAKTRLLGE
jgi:hypothetical protein